MSLLHTQGLTKRFAGRTVVDNLEFRVETQEIVGLLGPNGAGKTTTFSMVMGLVRPDAGLIQLLDEDITQFPVARRARAGIGYLAQEPSVFRKLSVRDNIMAVLEWIPQLSKGERQDRLDQILNGMALTQVADQKAGVLSGGERRRVEISRILVTEPKIILLDEPFSGVDPIAIEEIQQLIISFKDRGLGILITDHNVRETLRITDRSYIIHEGRILRQGPAETLIADEGVRSTYLGKTFSLHEIASAEEQSPPPPEKP